MPSSENISKLLFMDKIEFNWEIKVEKHTLLLNKPSPICRIAVEIKDTIYIISSQINNEKFIQIEYKINFNKKWEGLSTWVIPKWDKSNLNA